MPSRIATSGKAAGSFTLLAAFFVSCTGALVEPLPTADQALDDRLTLTGRVCTDPPNPNDFPVKVVFIVDESGSMCISDPPGSQQGNGFCEMPQVVSTFPPGQTQPARVRAIHQLIDKQFAGQSNVQVAIVPFETNVLNVWPNNNLQFAPPDGTTDAFIDQLQTELGNGTDYQGVLAYTYELISADISASPPEELPRTRYVIVFLTDGTPYPRCTAATNLPPQDYATPEQPWLTWQNESDYCTKLPSICQAASNSTSLISGNSSCVAGFKAGTDLNQNYQVFDAINQITALQSRYNVGSIRLDTVLLLNQAAVQQCGTICQDVYGTWPGVNPANYPQETFKAASWLLGQMAKLGNGVFQAFTNGQIQDLSLGGLDYTSLAAPYVMKNLIVQSLTSVPTPAGRIFDSDGDGLPDTIDNSFTIGTSAFDPDTDSDCFDDGFEVRHQADGFNPIVPDARGCLPPPAPACVCADTDGDGLSQYAEAYLGSNPGMVDSDGDGVPDGLEARYGFDPTKYDDFAAKDTDGDGVSDWDEFRANTDPTTADAQLYTTDGYQYDVTGTAQPDGTTCYDFSVSNLKLLQTPAHTGQRDGYDLYKIWFDEAPSSTLATDYGVWKSACAWAEYSPPQLRVPAGPDLSLNKPNGSSYFVPAGQLTDTATQCAGVAP